MKSIVSFAFTFLEIGNEKTTDRKSLFKNGKGMLRKWLK